jgi:hypothetical protein
LLQLTRVADVHAWLFGTHAAYTVAGIKGKQSLDPSSALAQTY